MRIESEINDATEAILNFARKHGLEEKPIRGKVLEYLKRFKPDHYHVLVRAGVIRDF